GVVQQRVLGLDLQTELVEEGGELDGEDVLELAHPGGDQVVDDLDGLVHAAVKEVLRDEHAVVQLALELDLLLVGEQVVEQADIVGGRVLQRLDRAGGVHLGQQR